MALEHDRLITPTPASPNEEVVERALRPRRLHEYVGQQRIREQLEIFIAAARGREEALDHLLLFGPPENFSITACSSLRSITSKPIASTSSMRSARSATLASMRPCALTSA